MSSLGGQWRVIRHYLSLSNLNSEVEKLVQKYKPASPEQWDNLIKRFEKAISAQIIGAKDIVEKIQDASRVKATAVEDANSETKTKNKIVEEVQQKAPSMVTETKELTVEGLWQGLKLKKDIHLGKISEPTWKPNKHTMTKSSIHSRTAYVVSAIVNAESPESVLRRTERLIEHLHEYPEARDFAIKEGAVRALLRAQDQNRAGEPLATDINGVVNEALALVGYTGPPRWAGANVLSLDGGGIRGIIAIEILRHLEKLTGRRAHELFDFIVGVSTGAIIAAVLASGAGKLEDAQRMYLTLSRDMFGNTTRLGGASRLVWTHSYYDTAAWEKMLQDNLKDCTLAQCNRTNMPKLALVSCVVNAGSRLSPFLFRSYEAGFRVRSVFPGTSNAMLWEAVRASAAAPTYFDEFRLRGFLHQDGGIVANNPTAVGLHEARLLFGPAAVARGTVLSVGTGRALTAHESAPAPPTGDPPSTSWKDKFNKILDSATDTEGVHLVLNDLLPSGSYFRFNPPLMQQCAMDEIDERKLDSVLVDTQAYIRRNQQKFEQAAAQLTRSRSVAQRVADYVTAHATRAGALAH